MLEDDFIEQYMDVLQNLEFGIVRVYREQPDLIDAEVDMALEALERFYRSGPNAAPPSPQNPRVKAVCESVKAMADLRLGHEGLLTESGQPVSAEMQPIAPEELRACLKRLRKSVRHWSKSGGRQGYLNFISQFQP